MSKLYANTDFILKSKSIPVSVESLDIDTDLTVLSNHVEGYCSVDTVLSSVATETLLLVDSKNRVLYNEYVANLSKRLGISPMVVSKAALENNSVQVVNYEISLEGWLGDIWNKIKTIFTKIYDAIKDFFTKYFTRLGRVKNKLDNLEKVLKETTKDLKQPTIDKVPSGLISKYTGFDTINEANVSVSVKSIQPLMSVIGAINKAAESFAKEDIVGRDFVAKIKELRETALKANTNIDENNEKKKDTGFFSKERSELKKDNKSLTNIANSATDEADKISEPIMEAGAKDLGDLEANRDQAKKQFDVFVKAVEEGFKPIVGKTFIGGNTIEKVDVKEDTGIEITMGKSDKTPDTCTLSDRVALLGVIKDTKELLKSAGDDVKVYGKVNDTIMTQLKTIDSLISDLDRTDPEKFGKYKKMLGEQVRHRLNLLKNFFSTYNKVGKNVFNLSVETADGVIEYSVVSMKYFG